MTTPTTFADLRAAVDAADTYGAGRACADAINKAFRARTITASDTRALLRALTARSLARGPHDEFTGIACNREANGGHRFGC